MYCTGCKLQPAQRKHLLGKLWQTSLEIEDYLRDQLSAKNTEVNYLKEHACDLDLKFKEMEDLRKEVFTLREELNISNSKQFSLIRELETKEAELELSALSVEKLDEPFSSMESQFEVETMKLDMMALEQDLFETKKVQDETLEENNRMSRLINELQGALHEAQDTIVYLNEENKEIKEKFDAANMNTRLFSQKVEDWLESKDRLQIKDQSRSKAEDTRNLHGNVDQRK
ncbi:uncharacterized protein LOC131653618 [Vicia villosa]|uniref:uncharacterized protein LOC131653618 n=1 Tax=Vicia villosa TaxID=3911 RepID=UPI00273C9D3D|nr:uncharacterized protein LOC131653618 [Vicia villosa]XP_058779847.1 uncharacterized protein LOC131653618 [Vicia villosa]XP_058779848.1 uncharacterized protein LOC131653618 [Vicia villosa]XP_058779849.1 uncharacterized protein LOC131653618 [Vicia villosa]